MTCIDRAFQAVLGFTFSAIGIWILGIFVVLVVRARKRTFNSWGKQITASTSKTIVAFLAFLMIHALTRATTCLTFYAGMNPECTEYDGPSQGTAFVFLIAPIWSDFFYSAFCLLLSKWAEIYCTITYNYRTLFWIRLCLFISCLTVFGLDFGVLRAMIQSGNLDNSIKEFRISYSVYSVFEILTAVAFGSFFTLSAMRLQKVMPLLSDDSDDALRSRVKLFASVTSVIAICFILRGVILLLRENNSWPSMWLYFCYIALEAVPDCIMLTLLTVKAWAFNRILPPGFIEPGSARGPRLRNSPISHATYYTPLNSNPRPKSPSSSWGRISTIS